MELPNLSLAVAERSHDAGRAREMFAYAASSRFAPLAVMGRPPAIQGSEREVNRPGIAEGRLVCKIACNIDLSLPQTEGG